MRFQLSHYDWSNQLYPGSTGVASGTSIYTSTSTPWTSSQTDVSVTSTSTYVGPTKSETSPSSSKSTSSSSSKSSSSSSSTTSSISPSPANQNSGHGMSAGDIGSVVGAVAGVLSFALTGYALWRNLKKRHSRKVRRDVNVR